MKEIRFLFPVQQDEAIQVMYRSSNGEAEAMTIPAALHENIRDLLRFVEAAGYEKIRPYLHGGQKLPVDLNFAWFGRDRLTLTFQ